MLGGIQLSPATDLGKAFAGGLLIGLSSTLMIALTGKITGISGVLHTLISGKNFAHRGWRVSYTVGLLGAGTLMVLTDSRVFGKVGGPELKPLAAVAAGLLTGFGARMGGGCTSGHGICGLPRLSLRSAVAVGTFMATGAASAALVNHPSVAPLLMRPAVAVIDTYGHQAGALATLAPAAAAFLATVVYFRNSWFPPAKQHKISAGPEGVVYSDYPAGYKPDGLAIHATALACAVLFGLGLGISGMTDPGKVSGFLHPFGPEGWDPSLMGVMGAGVGLNLLTFRWLSEMGGHPLLAKHLGSAEASGDLASCLPMAKHPKNLVIDSKLLTGAALFGLGWGAGGVCPGPSVVSLPAGHAVNTWVLPGIILGLAGYEALST